MISKVSPDATNYNKKERNQSEERCRSKTSSFLHNLLQRKRKKQMEENTLKFSRRATLVCRQSDPSQPIHFLSRRYDQRLSKCVMCRYTKQRTMYHLHCDTCDYSIHRHCYFLPRCRLSDITRPHTLEESYTHFSSCFTCGGEGNNPDLSYYCDTCDLFFHKVCHLYPPEIRHPFHPQHPLKLTFCPLHGKRNTPIPKQSRMHPMMSLYPI